MRFEYKVMEIDYGSLNDEAFNKLGAEGWRLVAMTAHQGLVGEADQRGRQESGVVFTHVFIREKR